MRIKLILLSGVLALAGLSIGLDSPIRASGTDAKSGCQIKHIPSTSKAESWLDDAKGQDVVSSVGEVVTKVFGPVTTLKEDPLAQVKQGYVGTAIDDDAKQLVVVVDPDSEGWTPVGEALEPYTATGMVRLQPSCVATQDLVEAGLRIMDNRSMIAVVGDKYGVELSPYTSAWEVTVNDTAAAADRADADLGKSIAVTATPHQIGRQSGSRGADAQPHWSGALIEVGGQGCTSGVVVVDTAQAGKAILTAGHCFAVGTNVSSGSYAYGSVTRRAPFPDYDVEVINASTQNYDDDIYANPVRAVGNPYDVSGTRSPAVGATTCLSGAMSRTTCNLTVEGNNAQICDGGCTYALLRYNASGSACQPGDSGSTVFAAPDGTHGARIDGQHVGEIGNGCVAEHIANIEYALNVATATSP